MHPEKNERAAAFYRELFVGAPDAMVVLDEAGTVLAANRAAAELLGCTTADLCGRQLGTGSAAPDGHPGVPGTTTWRGEIEVQRVDGSLIPIEASVAPLAMPEGTVYIAIWRDAAARRSLAQLHQALLTGIAHDLKNPLAAIKGQAQLLRRRAKGPHAARLAAGLAAIEASADEAATQLDELADLATLQVGQPLRLRLGPTDLAELARSHAAVFQAATERHTLQVVAPEPVTGIWDAARLGRVVDNLLGNAVKYSPEGGRIRVEVTREGSGDGEWAVLTVSDEGVGIPAADLPHVFERFHRGANVRRRIAGQGVGLAVVAQIVAQHGGTVTATSTEGRGSTFAVRLPLSPAAAFADRWAGE